MRVNTAKQNMVWTWCSGFFFILSNNNSVGKNFSAWSFQALIVFYCLGYSQFPSLKYTAKALKILRHCELFKFSHLSWMSNQHRNKMGKIGMTHSCFKLNPSHDNLSHSLLFLSYQASLQRRGKRRFMRQRDCNPTAVDSLTTVNTEHRQNRTQAREKTAKRVGGKRNTTYDSSIGETEKKQRK